MRIGLVTLQYPPHDAGGIGTYVQTVAAALARAGHDVTVVCSNHGQRRSTAVEDGVVVERFPILGPARLWRRLVRADQAQRVRLLHAVSTAWALRQLAPFDVVEVPEWKAQPLLVRGPFVVHLHLTLEIQHAWIGVAANRRLGLSYRLERRGVTRAARRTATSRMTTRLPAGRTWIPDDAVDIVVPPVLVGDWESAAPVAQTNAVVLFVGRLERRKAPEVVIEAVAHLLDEIPDVEIVYLGEAMTLDGQPYDAALAELARERGVPCTFLGAERDPERVREIYGRARVVAVPSRFETLSMVVLEAMSAGRPVVTTDHVGAAEWIRDEFPDSVVPVDDARRLAEALRPHLLDAGHATMVGERGRAFVRRRFDESEVVGSRMTVYRSAIEGHR